YKPFLSKIQPCSLWQSTIGLGRHALDEPRPRHGLEQVRQGGGETQLRRISPGVRPARCYPIICSTCCRKGSSSRGPVAPLAVAACLSISAPRSRYHSVSLVEVGVKGHV